jgi:hypothetical protein
MNGVAVAKVDSSVEIFQILQIDGRRHNAQKAAFGVLEPARKQDRAPLSGTGNQWFRNKEPGGSRVA